MESSSTPPSSKRAAETSFNFDSPAPKAAKEAAKPTFNKEFVPVSHFCRDGQASLRVEFTQYHEVKLPVTSPDQPPEKVWQVKKAFPIPAGITDLVDAVNAEFGKWVLAASADFDPNVATYRGNTARLTLLVAQPKDVNKVFLMCNKYGLFTNDFKWQNSYKEWLGRSHTIEYKINLSTIHAAQTAQTGARRMASEAELLRRPISSWEAETHGQPASSTWATEEASSLRPDVSVACRPEVRTDYTISFLTSHFSIGVDALKQTVSEAGLDAAEALGHYGEIEAALAANVGNTALREVVVVYDSVTPADNCTHLSQRIEAAVARVGEARAAGGCEDEMGPDPLGSAELRCIDRRESQPSYRQMFEYASSIKFKGDIVVMGNADGATDATIRRLSALQPGAVVVLSATGTLSTAEAAPVRRAYETLVGPLCSPQPTSRCLVTHEDRLAAARASLQAGLPNEWKLFRYPEQLFSWDAYAFHPPLPPLDETILAPDVMMNMIGAENRAVLALLYALGRIAAG